MATADSPSPKPLSTSFLNAVKTLLVAYLNIALSTEKIKNDPSRFAHLKLPTATNEIVFFASGYKISKRFLGNDSQLTIMFQKGLVQRKLKGDHKPSLAKQEIFKEKPKNRLSQSGARLRLTRIVNPCVFSPESDFATQRIEKELKVANQSSNFSIFRGHRVINLQ